MDGKEHIDDKDQTTDTEDNSVKKNDFDKVMGEFLNNLLDVFPEITNNIKECKEKSNIELQ